MIKNIKIDKHQFLKLYQTGLNDHEIGKKLNISHQRISYFRNILKLNPNTTIGAQKNNKNTLGYSHTLNTRKQMSNSKLQDKHWNWKGGTDQPFSKKTLYLNGVDITVCVICGSNKNIECHHINQNRYDRNINNCQILCREYHAKLHDKLNKKR